MTTERKALAFTKYDYKGWPVSFTIRGDSISEVLDSIEAQIDSLVERECSPWAERPNIAEVIKTEEKFDTEQPLEKDKVTGSYLGVLKYAPKSSELKPEQTYELVIDSYKLKDGEMQFWVNGSKYPAHTHKLNNIGVKVMAELFGNNWDKTFVKSEELQDFPKGEGIIKIQGSTKLTDHGNPYKNLVGFRRP